MQNSFARFSGGYGTRPRLNDWDDDKKIEQTITRCCQSVGINTNDKTLRDISINDLLTNARSDFGNPDLHGHFSKPSIYAILSYYESIRWKGNKGMINACLLFDRIFDGISIWHSRGLIGYKLNVQHLYYVVYYYALFLFNYKQKKSRKYSEYCLKLRLLNSSLHCQFSVLLSEFWKSDIQTAWYYLKLSAKRNQIILNLLNPPQNDKC